MAGKLYALLCRTYTKGRDWYDYSWYVRNHCSLNFKLLESSLRQLGPWKGQKIRVDEVFLKKALIATIQSLNWDDVKM